MSDKLKGLDQEMKKPSVITAWLLPNLMVYG